MTAEVTLYTRRDCHLCDEAAEMLDGLASELGFAVTSVDIDTDEAFRARYNDVIPVVVVGDVIVAVAPVDAAGLREALVAALR